MSYRCPLCLKPLNGRERLTRHCTYHPDRTETFTCQLDTLPYKIFCSDITCKSVTEIEEGVFLRHEGCEEHNPFWDGQKVTIAGESHESRMAVPLEMDGTQHSVYVQHWMLGMLRRMPPNTREMWFPLMLLRATAERNGSSRVGCFVELAGARAGGKTILAIQAMNPNACIEGALEIDNFVFSRNEGQNTFQRYIETLHLSSLLFRAKHDLFLPEGTPPGPRNLRVAFIKPSEIGGNLPNGDGSIGDHATRFAKIGYRYFKRLMKNDVSAGFLELFGTQGYRPYWHTLAFYDKSGEADEYEHVMKDTLDKVAVVLSAVSLFRADDDESIGVAVQRIRKAQERKQTCYLVITQLDLVRDQIGQDDWARVKKIADDLKGIGRDRGAIRKALARVLPHKPSPSQFLVESWLKADRAGNHRLLKERLKDLEEIFFVWTEDLPKLKTFAHQERLPTSHGLAKLICRCLDIEWKEIVRAARH